MNERARFVNPTFRRTYLWYRIPFDSLAFRTSSSYLRVSIKRGAGQHVSTSLHHPGPHASPLARAVYEINIQARARTERVNPHNTQRTYRCTTMALLAVAEKMFGAFERARPIAVTCA